MPHVPFDQTVIPLPSVGAGTSRALTVVRFGAPDARPKAYLQASVHADEIPPMLVLHHLRRRLEADAQEGRINGQIVMVPVANPPGLAQHVLGRSLGRYALGGGGNFNRHYPDIAMAVASRVQTALGDDAERNVAAIRDAMRAVLDEYRSFDETECLRLTLMRLAVDADIVLDLHCDSEALLHLYLGTPLWPGAADLSADLRSRATLLATVSGGNPFDEAVAGPWWALASRFPERPIPPACLGATVELRGERDVDDALAAADAEHLYHFLQRRGLVDGTAPPVPAAACEATPLEGTELLRAPSSGIVVYRQALGARVRAGEVLAELVDPLKSGAAARTALRAGTDGLVFARAADRLVRPGQVVCKVCGREPLPERAAGALLTD